MASAVPSIPSLEQSARVDIHSLRKVAAIGYFAGALMDVATTVLPDPDPSDHRQMVMIAVVPFLFASILWFGKNLSERAIKLFAISGAIVTISVMVAVILPMGAALMFYLWPALTAGYWCQKRELVGNLVLLGVTAGIALAVSRSPEITGSTWVVTVAVTSIVAFYVRQLADKIDELVLQIVSIATHDELTGLLNRRAFEPILEREVERAREVGSPLSVVVFDLDHFKRVNDRFGHAVGDEALKLFGAILRREVRDIDVAARMGGEEFTVLLFGSEQDTARAWAERVSGLLITKTGGTLIPLSVSAGVATAGGKLGTPEDLLLAADRALYAAKAAGRRMVVVAGTDQARLAIA
ncbi:MAG: GGDEF domain-containing protein [Solirubrobacteraceae bacterium]|nr:GGDEF domain-containing protein [Solirubrobacteraceae bacterium]